MSNDHAHLDWETKATADLKKVGVAVYASHPETDIWCGGWAIGDDPVEIWLPGQPLPQRLIDHVLAGKIVVCHNAFFEWYIWNFIFVPRYGAPPLPIEQMRCTMAAAYALSLPGSLENAAAAVGLDVGKDVEGRKLMLQMARPRRIEEDGTPIWWSDLPRIERLCQYCVQDVVVERALGKRILPLMPSELELWFLDHRVNHRGIQVDLKAIDAAMEVIASEKARLDKEIKKLTNGRANTCNQVMEITGWIQEQGVDCSSLAKGDVTDLLSQDIPEHVRAVLLCRQEAAKSSTAKLKAMKEAASADGRVRGILQFHGASTGRWAGRRIQPQNFPRGALGLSEADIENVFEVLRG